MTLLVSPPPNRYGTAPDTTGRYPGAAPPHRGTIIGQVSLETVAVFGRAGAQPNAEQAGWLLHSLTTGDEWGIRVNIFKWMLWTLGTTTGIAIEFRSAAEVATAAGGTHGAIVFAETNWQGTTGFPTMDGLSSSGQAPGDYGVDRWVRILIRDDLATGGAGSAWSGRAFLVETMMHELGHACMMLVADLYDDDYLINNTCDLFGKPNTDWNSLSIPWEDRVVEANAEFFKDVAFPLRRYSSRASYGLPRARFDDWVELFFDLLNVPYWGAGNTGLTMRAAALPGDNIGATSYVAASEAPRLQFVPDGVSAPEALDPHIYAWPPDGTMRMHYAYDPRPIFTPGFGLWEDLIYVEVPPAGPPNGYNSPALGAQFFDKATGTIFYGGVEVPIWNLAGAPNPPDPSGVASAMPTPDILAAVPAGIGADVYFGFSGHTLPKYDIPGDDFLWPWVDWSLRRARPFPSEVTWPYGSRLIGAVRTGPARTGNRRSSHAISGVQASQQQVPTTVLQIPPVTVTDGLQELGVVATVTLVTTLDLPSTGRIKVVDRHKSIVLAYTGTTPTTLTGVTYIKGDVGTYADGSRVYLSPVPDPSTT